MTHSNPSDLHRLLLALAVLAAVLLTARYVKAEPDECTVEDGDITCPKPTWLTIRDKARGFELFCSQTEPLASMPTQIAALCDQPSRASRIWVRSKKYRKAQKTAREMQRKANVAKGRRAEAVRETKALRQQVEQLSEDKGRALKARKQWRAFSLGAAGVAVVTGGILLGDVAHWWDVP